MAAPAAATTPDFPAVEGGAFGKKALGWATFEFARNPYYNLVVIYVFAPYLANVVAGGGVTGQVVASINIAVAGIICAIMIPLLGQASDLGARIKPLAAMALLSLGISAAFLWFVAPGGLGLALGMVLLMIGYVSYTVAEVMHNAILPMAGRPKVLPVVSGMGIGLGNLGAVIALVLMLVLVILPVRAGDGEARPFGLNPDDFEHVRIVGPAVAVWMLLFILPFFLFVPEVPNRRGSWRGAMGMILFGEPDGTPKRGRLATRAKGIAGYLRGLNGDHPDACRFLIARLIYADGMAALLTIGAVYVSGFLLFSETEVIIMGLATSVLAAMGAFAAGWLDTWLGARRAVILELSSLLFLLLFLFSITRESLFFGLIAVPPESDPEAIFGSLSDQVYMALIVPAAMLVGAVITSSRVLLLQLAPAGRVGEFFGLYQIAGTITVWMGPMLVGVFTIVSGSQRVGMTAIWILLGVGLAILLTIRKGARMRAFGEAAE